MNKIYKKLWEDIPKNHKQNISRYLINRESVYEDDIKFLKLVDICLNLKSEEFKPFNWDEEQCKLIDEYYLSD